ncbi:MAG: alcohol dehydrogenase catalytic domain-containing protein [Bacteroidales bacterium]|nr:alcohol dehydrogenase catalytic domain-containing protein [Bacteroidales bacterium]
MKAMMLTGIRQMEMKEVATPAILNDRDVLIKMKTLGVCGSDIHYYVSGKIGSQVVQYPFTVGHEGAGEVEAVGEGVTLVKPGDRIAIEPAMPCGECDQCKVGRPHTCRKLRFLGCPGQAEGSLSEFIVMPETSCFKIPDQMTYDEAAISEPLAIGLYAVKQSIPMEGAKVGILGFGPIGMSVLLSALAMGAAEVFVTDKIDERLKIAEKSSALLTANPDREDVVEKIANRVPELLDVVFECCGQQDAIDSAVELLKPGGKLMIIGIPEFDRWSLPVDKSRHKELTIQNVRRQNEAVQPTLDMMADGEISVSEMVTHRFSFENTKDAFDLVAGYKDGVMKAMIDFE